MAVSPGWYMKTHSTEIVALGNHSVNDFDSFVWFLNDLQKQKLIILEKFSDTGKSFLWVKELKDKFIQHKKSWIGDESSNIWLNK